MKQHLNKVLTLITSASKTVSFSVQTALRDFWNFVRPNNRLTIAVKWIVRNIADMFRKIPSELTYWLDGVLFTVQVDDFVELAPNLIQYRDNETKKRVKVKAEYPIKYILKEK